MSGLRVAQLIVNDDLLRYHGASIVVARIMRWNKEMRKLQPNGKRRYWVFWETKDSIRVRLIIDSRPRDANGKLMPRSVARRG